MFSAENSRQPRYQGLSTVRWVAALVHWWLNITGLSGIYFTVFFPAFFLVIRTVSHTKSSRSNIQSRREIFSQVWLTLRKILKSPSKHPLTSHWPMLGLMPSLANGNGLLRLSWNNHYLPLEQESHHPGGIWPATQYLSKMGYLGREEVD